jgi:hypothetical protein
MKCLGLKAFNFWRGIEESRQVFGKLSIHQNLQKQTNYF